MGAAFFNQPWLVERYRPGTRLLLHGTARRGGALRGRQSRARGRRSQGRDGGGGDRALPRHGGRELHPDSGPGARATAARSRTWGSLCRRGCVRASACPTARRRSRRCTSRAAPRRPRGRAPASRSRSCCDAAGGAAPPRAARPRERDPACRPIFGRARELTARWLQRAAAVRAHRRPDRRDGGDRRRPRARAPDAAPADGGGRLGQDGGGAVRAAACGRARDAGGADGADGDARRTALRHAADARPRGAAAVGAADRLDSPAPPRGSPGEARLGGAEAGGRHARADRGRRSSSTASRWRWSTSSTASACASARRSTARAPASWPPTCCT